MLQLLVVFSLFLLLALFRFTPRLGYSLSLSRFLPRSSGPSRLFDGKFLATLGSGIMGTVKGKVGGVVGSTWKGINTLREYKIPANPNTPAQQSQRSRFSAIQSLASQFLSTIIDVYWNPLAVKMSGYNSFIQANINGLADTTFLLTTSNLMAKGNLEPVFQPTCIMDTDVCAVEWETDIHGNGLSTDVVKAVIINKDTLIPYFSSENKTRANTSLSVATVGETDATKLLCFIFTYRGTGSSYMQADAYGITVTPA